jgi:hypothetical protein
MQSVPNRRQSAKFPHSLSRNAPAGSVLGDPVAEVRHAVVGEVQVESAQDRAVVRNEHVVGADAGVLLSQQDAVLRGELIEKLVAAIGDGGGEVGAVCPLKHEDRGLMAGIQPLQIKHGHTLSRWCARSVLVPSDACFPYVLKAARRAARAADSAAAPALPLRRTTTPVGGRDTQDPFDAATAAAGRASTAG